MSGRRIVTSIVSVDVCGKRMGTSIVSVDVCTKWYKNKYDFLMIQHNMYDISCLTFATNLNESIVVCAYRQLIYTFLQLMTSSYAIFPELVSVLSNLHIATARLARKQTNYALAEKLLILQVNNLSLPAEDRPLNAMIRTEGAQKLLPTLDRLEKIWDTSKMLEVLCWLSS